MVLVDYAGKTDMERPDFYVLTLDDWLAYVRNLVEKYPNKGIELDSDNCPIWTSHIKDGKPYKGSGINVRDVVQHLEKWKKIIRLLE